MKLRIIFIIAFVSLIGSIAYCQFPVLNDTLQISTRFFDDGTLEIIYRDINEDKLPKPLRESKDVPELINFQINSVEKLVQIANEIFTKEEIEQLIESKFILDCKILPSGKIISASCVFYEKNPHICLKKLTLFSQEIKERLSITPIFSEEIDEEGYVQWSIFAYSVFRNILKQEK
ncbi:hypothetical protein [Anaerophaga thermohalophila]|uniref:hypothetical protein n=1 Tax=Anaerophaga thermohalophila TaxID=177400 RepID=UPI000237D5DB|nr:hypothetical protein [Anaerophaga thermohalophila]